MLTEDYAPQYKTPCVLSDSDAHTADEIIELAREIGATYEEPDGSLPMFDQCRRPPASSLCFVVQFPGRPQELYTESALRRSCASAQRAPIGGPPLNGPLSVEELNSL